LLAEDGVYAAMWNRQRAVDEARRRLDEADREAEEPLPETQVEAWSKRAASFTP
jgi:hypothetical protein